MYGKVLHEIHEILRVKDEGKTQKKYWWWTG